MEGGVAGGRGVCPFPGGGGESRRVGWGGGGSGGAIWGAHAPKAKRWSITGSPYLPLPSLWPYHHPKPKPNLCSELVRPCQPR